MIGFKCFAVYEVEGCVLGLGFLLDTCQKDCFVKLLLVCVGKNESKMGVNGLYERLSLFL